MTDQVVAEKQRATRQPLDPIGSNVGYTMSAHFGLLDEAHEVAMRHKRLISIALMVAVGALPDVQVFAQDIGEPTRNAACGKIFRKIFAT